MKRTFLLFAALFAGAIQAQTNCTGEDPGMAAGSTSCVTFSYDGATVQYTTVRGGDGKIWLQQNLGSAQVATSSTDEAAYGDLYQWGRWQDGHEKRNSATSTAVPSPNNPTGLLANNTFITSSPRWWETENGGLTWSAPTPAQTTETDGCDPCKAAMGNGWRVPTDAEWAGIIESENITDIATAFSSSLKLTVAGSRSGSNGSFTSVGQRGYYWSSVQSPTNAQYAKYLYYSNITMNPTAGGFRSQGSSVRCIKDAVATVPNPSSITIFTQGSAPSSITADDGTLQLLAIVAPAGADQSVTWSITEGNQFATVSGNGLVTALNNGTVTIQATSSIDTTISNTVTISITNQLIQPESIVITTQDDAEAAITTNEGTLQLTAAVLPSGADQSVTWSIVAGSEFATVSTTGLVTAIANGTAVIQAVSNVDATILNTKEITITGQYVAPESLEITVAGANPPSILTAGGTLQLEAAILPAEANQAVTWSIISGNAAIVNTDGLVTATANGTVMVQAVSNDDGTILNAISVIITNQNLPSAAPYCDVTTDYDVEPISRVYFAGIDNTTSAAVNATQAYEDFTAITGTVTKGVQYTFAAEGNTVGLYSHDIRIFIDWNQNGVFDMETEYYLTAIEGSTGDEGIQGVVAITVPQDAVSGTTRMRVTKDNWNVYEPGEFDACTNAYYGQIEDYSLLVNEPTAGLDNNQKTAFTLYPNPTDGSVNIQSDAEVIVVEAFNLAGQRIAVSTSAKLDLNKANAGVYLVKISFADGSTAVEKVIRK